MFDLIRDAFRRGSGDSNRGPPRAIVPYRLSTVDAAGEILATTGHLLELLIQFSHRPVSGTIFINGKEPSGMPIQLAPGQTVDIVVSYTDEWHNVLSGVATTIRVTDASGADDAAAFTVTPDAANPQHATAVVNAASGTSGLVIHADPTPNPQNIDLASDTVNVLDGPAFTGAIVLTPK